MIEQLSRRVDTFGASLVFAVLGLFVGTTIEPQFGIVGFAATFGAAFLAGGLVSKFNERSAAKVRAAELEVEAVEQKYKAAFAAAISTRAVDPQTSVDKDDDLHLLQDEWAAIKPLLAELEVGGMLGPEAAEGFESVASERRRTKMFLIAQAQVREQLREARAAAEAEVERVMREREEEIARLAARETPAGRE